MGWNIEKDEEGGRWIMRLDSKQVVGCKALELVRNIATWQMQPTSM